MPKIADGYQANTLCQPPVCLKTILTNLTHYCLKAKISNVLPKFRILKKKGSLKKFPMSAEL